MASYAELQAEHQRLLHLIDQGADPAELLAAVKAYVARVRSESPSITAPRDRDQLRANLRFWGSYLFDKTGEYPDTTLRPADASTGIDAPGVGMAASSNLEAITQPPTTTPQWAPPRPTLAPPAGYQVPPMPASGNRSGRRTRFGTVALIAIVGLLVCGTALLGIYVLYGPSIVNSFATTVPGLTGTPPAAASSAPSSTQPKRTATPLTTATPIGTSGPPATQSPTQAGLPYQRLELLAQVSQQSGAAGCAGRSLSITVDSAGLLDPKQLGGGQVELTRAGGDSVTSQPLSPDHNSLDLTQLGVDQDNTFLLRVEHPQLTFASVIIQFSPDCTRNETAVHYVAQNAPSNLDREPARSPDLKLAWTLMTWGPAPQAPRRWVAQLKLAGEGGDGQYIFWDGSSYSSNTSLLFSESDCTPDRRLAGVSSGGEAVLREIVLQAPGCT